MKTIVYILLFVLPLPVFAQVQDTVKFKKVDMGVTFSPDYCYRTLKTDETNRDIAAIYDTIETAKYGYTTGINGVYKINRKLSLSTGILFSDKGEGLKENTLPSVLKYTNHYYYLDVPLKLNYNYFLTKKIKLFISAGVSTNLFLTQKTTLQYENSTIESSFKSNVELSAINVAVLAGTGMDCSLSKRWYFKAEFLYRQSLTPMMSSPVKRYLYSFGPNCGIYYHF